MASTDRASCVAQIEGDVGTYGYQPSLGAGIAFCVLFGGSMLAHTFVSMKYKTYWQLVFSVGAVSENSSEFLFFIQLLTGVQLN